MGYHNRCCVANSAVLLILWIGSSWALIWGLEVRSIWLAIPLIVFTFYTCGYLVQHRISGYVNDALAEDRRDPAEPPKS